MGTNEPSAASGFALGRNQKIEGRLLQIRRMFFASAFLFTASAFGEGGEKRTTAKNKKPKVPFSKKSHKILLISRLQLAVLKITHKKQEIEGLYYKFYK